MPVCARAKRCSRSLALAALRRTARALILVASGKRAMAYDTAEQVLENKPT